MTSEQKGVWTSDKSWESYPEPPKLEKRPVAWRIKDGDGWIITQDEHAAYLAHEKTGAEMQGLYVRDGT